MPDTARDVRFSEPLYPAPHELTGAPAGRDSNIGTWVAGPGFDRQTLAFPTADVVALR